MKLIALLINVLFLSLIVLGCEADNQPVSLAGTLWTPELLQEDEFPSTVYKFDPEGILRFRTQGRQWKGDWTQNDADVIIHLDGATYETKIFNDSMALDEEELTLIGK